jgi:hypothetical protein
MLTHAASRLKQQAGNGKFGFVTGNVSRKELSITPWIYRQPIFSGTQSKNNFYETESTSS